MNRQVAEQATQPGTLRRMPKQKARLGQDRRAEDERLTPEAVEVAPGRMVEVVPRITEGDDGSCVDEDHVRRRRSLAVIARRTLRRSRRL
jgi:hypothetical protein